MKVIRLFILIYLSGAISHSHAQNRLTIHEDKRVQILCHQKDSLIICWLPGKKSYKGPGYRILVRITDDRNAAYQLKHKLQERYTGHNVYMSYQTPNFKLKLGDFLVENEAQAFNVGLSRDLKLITSVIPDMIPIADNIQKADEQPCIENKLLPMYTQR